MSSIAEINKAIVHEINCHRSFMTALIEEMTVTKRNSERHILELRQLFEAHQAQPSALTPLKQAAE